MLGYLRSAYPHAHILSMALLPRGPLSANGTYVVQPSGFTPAVQAFNAALLAYSRGDSHVHYVDCGPALLPDGQVRPCDLHWGVTLLSCMVFLACAGLATDDVQDWADPCCKHISRMSSCLDV